VEELEEEWEKSTQRTSPSAVSSTGSVREEQEEKTCLSSPVLTVRVWEQEEGRER
jgi:hypothetical protein